VELDRYPSTAFGGARRTSGRHGYVAYFPKPIPRNIELAGSTVRLLADAEASLGRLAGVGRLVPNPELLIRPYLLREALASTRIEGTQATVAEVYEVDAAGEAPNPDVEEVLNYIEAMRWALMERHRLPISSRMLCELHRRLMAGVRGRERAPGELRKTQNWIGSPNSTVETAEFVPPPANELAGLLTDWERFANEEPDMPLLVQDALLHSRFETIHPFLDGNGRLGRLLLVLFLIERGRIDAPLLFLSSFLESERRSYYRALAAVQLAGDPMPWIELFLTAVDVEALDAVVRAERLVELQQRYRHAAADMGTANGVALVDLICEHPLVTTRFVEGRLGVSRPTALRLLDALEKRGVVSQVESGARGQRRYAARELMAVVADEFAGPGPDDVLAARRASKRASN
jgi:Fic family protein